MKRQNIVFTATLNHRVILWCFFDDALHDFSGFENNEFQSIYRFTTGEPVEDQRLTAYPPYYHFRKNIPGYKKIIVENQAIEYTV
jgi:hypothetical protein